MERSLSRAHVLGARGQRRQTNNDALAPRSAPHLACLNQNVNVYIHTFFLLRFINRCPTLTWRWSASRSTPAAPTAPGRGSALRPSAAPPASFEGKASTRSHTTAKMLRALRVHAVATTERRTGSPLVHDGARKEELLGNVPRRYCCDGNARASACIIKCVGVRKIPLPLLPPAPTET